MRVSRPISVTLPPYGALFAESVHAADFRMAERADPFHKLIYVLQGRVAYRESRGHPGHPAEAGTLLVVPRGTSHRFADELPSTLLLLCLTEEFLARDPDLPQLWAELERLPGHRVALARPARHGMEDLWRRALMQRHDRRPGGGVLVRAIAAQIVVQLARLPPQPTDSDAAGRVAAVVAELDESFPDPWSLDRAAGRAALSRRRFSELFRLATKRTFWAYLTERRLDHAARLLRAGEHSVMGVMFSCGFNDVSHFYRLFRKKFGRAPAGWARLSRAPGRTRR
jgi:AraC-like DNA-binding protein